MIGIRLYAATLAALLAGLASHAARAEPVPFTATLEIRAGVGTDPQSFPLLAVEGAGVAEIEAGVVHIPAGELSALVPNLSGFGGVLVNGPATFSAGGAGPGATCPLQEIQEVCIAGGGFGGVMALGGVTQQGQALTRWGLGGSALGATSSGLPREERATRWTEGNASAWFYLPELDPVTPFLLETAGSFRGLPSTFAGPGPAGFSLVTPVVVTSGLAGSAQNVRAVASLRIDFVGGHPVPVGGVGILAALLGVLGAMHLRLRSASFVGKRPVDSAS